jgi:hypothetical protein
MQRLIEVQDIVGPLKYWPAYILDALFCTALSGVNHLALSAFFMVMMFLNYWLLIFFNYVILDIMATMVCQFMDGIIRGEVVGMKGGLEHTLMFDSVWYLI